MKFFDSKTFNAEAFGRYMNAIPNTKLNKLRQSGAVVTDARLNDAFSNQTGTAYAILPYYGLISSDALNYDGETDLTARSTASFAQGVFTYGRMQAWTEADFSYDITGKNDFMGNIRAQITDYWNGIDQGVLLSILKGVFSMTGTKNKKFVDGHTLDLSKGTGDAAKIGPTTLNTAITQACGDNRDKFSLVFMHSAVAAALENQKALEFLKYTDAQGIERALPLGTWNGRTVVVDDDMPVETSETSTAYTTYILGQGAIGFNDIGAKVPFEMFRDPHTKGGEDELISRQRHAVSVAGISYTASSQKSNSPTNAELETAANWSLVSDNASNTIDPKAIPIARIVSLV